MGEFSHSAGNRRLPLVLLTACLALAALGAEVFVFTNLGHDCTGEHCSVCLQIETARNLLEGLGRVGIVALAAYLIPQILVIIKRYSRFSPAPQTLVALKVKYSC